MLSPSSGSSEDSESPATVDDGRSPTRPVPPRPPPLIAATSDNGPPHTPQASEASPVDLGRRAASHGGHQRDLGSTAEPHGKVTLPAVPDASGLSHSVDYDDRPRDRKELTSSLKTTDGVIRRENQHGRQPQGGPAPGDDTKRISVLPGQVAVVGKHPSAASGPESTSKPASAIPPHAPPPMTSQSVIQIDSATPSTAPRLILTKDQGLVPVQPLPQVGEAVRRTAAPPVQEQGGTAVELPLRVVAALPVAAKKEEMLSSNRTSQGSHDERAHGMRGRPVQHDESTSSESEDYSSSPAKRSPVNVRRPMAEARRTSEEAKRAIVHDRRASAESMRSPLKARRAMDDFIEMNVDDKGPLRHVRRPSVESVRLPVQARRATEDSLRGPVDDKDPSLHAKRISADSGRRLVSIGEPPAQQATRKAPERSAVAPSEKAVTAAGSQNSERPSSEEGPPPPPPSADAIGASTKAAASAKAGMKRSGSIAPTPAAQPSPPPKPSWWSAFANPFSLAAADAVPPAGGHEEAAAPSHAHRHSVAVAENLRALGRTNLRMKRTPVIAEELREYAAALDTGGGGWTSTPPVAPLATTGGAAPQQNVMIEDYLDYEHGPRLEHSLDIEVSIDDSSRRRRRNRRTCAGLMARCLLLLMLVMVPCTLLFFTFRLGQLLYKTTQQYNIAQTKTTETTTKEETPTAVTAVPTGSQSIAPTSTTAATTTSSTTPLFPDTEEFYDDTSDRDPSCAEPVYTAGANLTEVVDFSSRSYTNRTTTQYRKLICVLDSKHFSPRRLYVLERLPIAYCSELIYYALHVTRTVAMKRFSLDSDIFNAIVHLRDRRLHRGKKMRLHVALGGSRRDSPSLVRLLEHYEVRDAAIKDLDALKQHFDGVNIHWDRPGDACDKEFTGTFFRALIEELRRRRFVVMLTVPPVVELVRRFWLINIMRYLEYVIVLTHTLRRKGVLDCPGRRQFAAASYHAIQEHVFKETSNPLHATKIVYSISLGADVFKATLPLNHPRLLDAATPSSVFNGPTVQTYKTSYDHVCRLPKHAFDNDGECVWVLGASSASGTEVALYSGPEELTLRMRRSYADRIGDATVAVYDLFLDDFDGHCSRPGQLVAESPLVAAIAEASLPH
ncbi:uncharacterized protein LOC144134126 [Amblyomma americanum]